MTGDQDMDAKTRLLEAAIPHVAFDGWSDATLRAAANDADIPLDVARALCPRGAVDLALAYHQAGDEAMAERLAGEPLDEMRIRDRITRAVQIRIEAISDREAVRRGMTLFALPQHAGDGARAIWNTADRIWSELGDPSEDLNWYTKRATLSGVYSATVLYWLGDDSPDHGETWSFLDRRIDDVMRIEKTKAAVRSNPLLKPFLAGPEWLAGRVKAPRSQPAPEPAAEVFATTRAGDA